MIPENEEQDRVEDFLQILLIGELFTSSQMEEKKKCIWDILQKCGVIPDGSDFTILDHCRIGNSTITIARYTLQYREKDDSTGKKVCVEGTVTMEADDLGSRHIRISSRTVPFGYNFDTSPTEESLIHSKI
jgi:hypothetical protein